MTISIINKKTLNILLFSAAGLFFIEVFLAKYGYFDTHRDNRFILMLFLLPPLLATICFFILLYNKCFKAMHTSLLGILMRGLFCILTIFMLVIWTVLITKFII